MKKLKIIEARFAETVKIGLNQEEIYICPRNDKHKKYEMYLDEVGMLWIHDTLKDEWTGTSTANLRSITAQSNPFGVIKDEIPSGKPVRRIGKTGETGKSAS